jgi:hypothetical protein
MALALLLLLQQVSMVRVLGLDGESFRMAW